MPPANLRGRWKGLSLTAGTFNQLFDNTKED